MKHQENNPNCINCQSLAQEIVVLNNLLVKFMTRNERLETRFEALRQTAIGELCGIEIADPVDMAGLEERE